MNADFARKEAAFMDWYLPKKDQRTVDDRMMVGDAGALDPTNICVTYIGPAADKMKDMKERITYDMYDSDGKFRGSDIVIPLSNFNQRVAVNRNVLMKLLEPMTSEYVIFDVACDYPMRVIGEIGEKNVAATLLPIIKDD